MQDFCDTNYLQPSGFKVNISKKNYPYISFLAQQVSHPSMETDPVELPYKRITAVSFTGDKITHGTVNIDVILDDNLQVYEELYNWMHRMVNTKHNLNAINTSDRKELSDYADMTVSILNSSNNKSRSIKYLNAFPVSLGDINLTSASEETFITCPISFKFDYFALV